MPVEGAIAARTKGILPITWDALSKDSRYGDSLLQTVINTTKENVTGVVIAPAAESTTYSLVVIDFIAKMAAIQIIPAGIDFWMNEPVSESSSGTNENHEFVDRAAQLSLLRTELLKETRLIAEDIAGILGFRRSPARIPRLNTIDDPLLTPSPQEFPRPYRETTFS